MNIRSLGVAALSIAALLPKVSTASPEKASLNACARAFATSLVSPGAAVPAYKLDAGKERFANSFADSFMTEYTFDLEARDSTGSAIARVRCSTDRRGTPIVLSPMPLTAAAPTLAAQR